MLDGWAKLVHDSSTREDEVAFKAREELKNLVTTKELAIIKNSIHNNMVFDLESMELNDKIITSSETDTMVIRAAGELLKILITGNQCIYVDSDVNNSHQEEADIYS